jgi:hypothetical protein
MGRLIHDRTSLLVLFQLNTRFEAGEALDEMVALQKEFQIFSPEHTLQQSFALLNIAPADWGERQRWYRFLRELKNYPSDVTGMNGHDRIVSAYKDDLESRSPQPVFVTCHAARDDKRVTVGAGRPMAFLQLDHVVISIPTTPSRVARQDAAKKAQARRTSGAAPKRRG